MAAQVVAQGSAEDHSANRRSKRRMRAATLGMILALLIQFAAGMLVNLFTTIPSSHPGSQPPDYFAGSFESIRWAITQSGLAALIFHTAWGLLLVVNGVALILLARRVGIRSVTVAAALGFLFIVGAGFNGASFLDFQADYSSMIMATLFGLAMFAYAVVLFCLPADA
jgi:hypothetical protein